MINEELKNQILKSISYSGSADTDIKMILGSRTNLQHVVDMGSGRPRIHRSIGKRFTLVLSQPIMLANCNPFEIRCCLCGKVVSYPCWYYQVKYAVNHFHYFICFDRDSADKPSTKCYRRIA